jgi:hypothetical protein
MKKINPSFFFYVFISLIVFIPKALVFAQNKTPRFFLAHHPIDQSVSISIDNKPFTSYLYPDSLPKSVLYPLRTPLGTIFTRGYPLAPRPQEYIDHPHHLGHWFNYGSVNEIDFWNNSSAIPMAERKKYGAVKHQRINKIVSSDTQGELSVDLLWITNNDDTLLRENSIFVFGAIDSNTWYFDRIITLTALSQDVRLYDNKEGMFAVRLAHELEHPVQRPDFAIDNNGNITKEPVLNNATATGRYRNSNGIEGDETWGKRANWLKLTGKIGQENITLAILDNEKNIGSPTYWHARGYGLFAANNLGEKIFTNGAKERKYILTKDTSVTFKYRFIVNSKTGLTDTFLHQQFANFK